MPTAGYAGGLGGGLSVGRGSLAVLERCSLENNFAKTDGQLVGRMDIHPARISSKTHSRFSSSATAVYLCVFDVQLMLQA